jgi:anti-sigma regulatory factor (Ser/Thr protein kinase)
MAAGTSKREPRAGEDPRSTNWDGGSELSLHLALRRPAMDCVETELLDRNVWRRRPRAANRLSLTVTTRSTYRQPIAKAFAAGINDRVGCSKDLYQRMRTALQEAIMNAVMHGNLGLASQFRGNLQGLAASHAVIEELLDRPAVARSVIGVDATWNAATLQIVVRDSGKGFTRNRSETPEALRSERCHGRGLLLLDTFCDRVAVVNGGTTVKMTFRL